MTEIRDAYATGVKDWVRTPDNAYARLYEPGRAYQYRIVKAAGVAPSPPPETADPNRDGDWRDIPPRPQDPQLSLL